MRHSLNRRTREYYDRLVRDLGPGYLDHRWRRHRVQRSHYRQTRRAIGTFFTREVGHVDTLLEVGPGPGTWTDICLAHSDEVTVLDISVEMLRAARERLGEERVRFVCADLTDDPVRAGGSFDVAFSARALEYMEDKRAAMAKLHDHLRPGGIAGIVTKNPQWRDKVRDQRHGREDAARIQTHWIGWQELATIFSEVGFHDVRAWPVALGSYGSPYDTVPGTALTEVVQWIRNGRPMRTAWDPLTESYLVFGRRAA